ERLNTIGRADGEHTLLRGRWIAPQEGFIEPRPQPRTPAMFKAEAAHFDQHRAEKSHPCHTTKCALLPTPDSTDTRARTDSVNFVEENHCRAVLFGFFACFAIHAHHFERTRSHEHPLQRRAIDVEIRYARFGADR